MPLLGGDGVEAGGEEGGEQHLHVPTQHLVYAFLSMPV
jgi:hypothetical protein